MEQPTNKQIDKIKKIYIIYKKNWLENYWITIQSIINIENE